MKDYSLKHARMVEEMFKTGVENEVQGLLAGAVAERRKDD